MDINSSNSQNQPQNGYPQNQPQYGNPQIQPQYSNPQNQPQYGYPQNQPQYGNPQNQPQYGNPQIQPQYGNPQSNNQQAAPYIPGEIIEREKRAFGKTVVKLAVFAAIVVLNTNFMYYVFYYPAYYIVNAMGDSAGLELRYFLSWLTNDLCAYLIPALSAYFLFKNEIKEKIPYPPHPSCSPLLNGALTFFASCFLGSLAGLIANGIAALLDSIYGTGEIPDAMESSVPPQGELASFGIMFFFVAVAAPVFEELIFRKLLLYPLRRHGNWFAIITTALLFGFYHGNFDQMPYAFVVGMLFALLAVNTNSVIPSMILHVLNNVTVTLSQYLTAVTGETEPALSISNWVAEGLGWAFWLGIPAIALMIAGKLFHTTTRPWLTAKTKAGLLFKNPAFYVFCVCTALMMVDILGLLPALAGYGST